MQLEIETVSKQYRKGTWALQGVSLRLKLGAIGLLGPNGAGKTSLMNILATITRASSGRVLMKTKQILFVWLLILGGLLVACTTPGVSSSTVEPDPSTQLVYEGSRFSLSYPITATFFENERPSTDGVMAPLENGIALQDSGYLLTVTTFDLVPDASLTDFIDSHLECLEVSSSGGQSAQLGNLQARLYPDTLCGLNGITYLYAVQGGSGYRLAIESSDAFATVQPAVQTILDSFQAAEVPVTASVRQVEHNGIRFSYDPALLGDVNIQENAATADQGTFGQPTPALTWFGFVPEGIVRDGSIHWSLLREPQVIVFNLNDFGSFAPGDAQARERVAAFQQVLAERPSTFAGEIPILPPINAAQTVQAQVQWLDFDSGSGVRFLTSHTQEVAPVANDRLVYIFYGLTDDGLHGVTAVFPIAASALPDTPPTLSDEAMDNMNVNYDVEMQAVTDQLNALTDADFQPQLAQLDALVQSITIVPQAGEFVVTAVPPQNAQTLAEIAIFAAPNDQNEIGTLAAGTGVVINGSSSDGQYSRILCANGSTGNCWVAATALQLTDTSGSKPGLSNGLIDGQVAQIQSLVENVIFVAPDEDAAQLGSLLVGEVANVFTSDDSGDWYNIECPRNIGVNCWVITNPDVNEAIGFYSSDGWRPIIGEYVSFRVPIEWAVTAVSPGGGSMLEEWRLGIPGVESDQSVAFFAVAFDALQPSDLESETPFEIGGQPGAKWVRSGQGYVSYDYYTTGTGDAGSFGIHVTVSGHDCNLEAQMDKLAASVVFTP